MQKRRIISQSDIRVLVSIDCNERAVCVVCVCVSSAAAATAEVPVIGLASAMWRI